MKNIYHLFIISGIFGIVFFGCEKETKECYCETENPVLELPWLKNILDNRFCTLVYEFKYNDEEYIAISDCEPPDLRILFYTCDGNKWCEIGGIFNQRTCSDEFIQEFEQTKKLIYKKDK